MRKNKNAFTFVELLAVITIIGVLVLIAIPTMDKIIKDGKEEVYQRQLDNIVLALRNWASDNKEYLPVEDGELLTLTLGNLKSEGYMEYEVKNPKNNKCFDNSMNLKIVKNQKSYDYSIDLATIKESDSCEFDLDSPVIVFNGNSIELVEVNSVYNDLGVIAKDKDGNDITSNVTKTISGSGSSIDTSKLNNQYIITYSVSVNGKSSTASKTVKIVDTTKPNLIIPANITIGVGNNTFDAMSGVSVTDNSGENIEVKVKSNLSLGIAGNYTITYTATDSSGNTATLKRIVTISNKTLADVATTSTDLGVTSVNACAKSGTCANGTPFVIKVSDTESYKFYVIKDTGREVELIMDRNLDGKVAWYSSATTASGPLTAIKALEEKTAGWTNILAYNYTYTDDGGGNKYSSITRNNVRARLLTYTEATNLGCKIYQADGSANKSCPTYLYDNLTDKSTPPTMVGYWLSAADPSDSSSAQFNYGRIIHYYGDVSGSIANDTAYIGIRPVIKISK